MSSLDVRGVSVKAGGNTILSGVSARFSPGSLVALLGPSGSGKSTLLKVILGLREAASGDVRYGGAPFTGPVGYVPQDEALHRTLTTERALHFAATLRLPEASEKERGARIDEVLKLVGLAERRDVKIGRLSGGQRRRVAVALELITSPPVLVLDEPTSGLDPGMEAQMMALFQSLAKTGRIVLVTTHATESLERCDELLVLVGGFVAFQGSPGEALRYFRVTRHAEIFQTLAKQSPVAWSKTFQRHRPLLEAAG